MCMYLKTETVDHSIGKILCEKNMGVWGQFLKKWQLCLQNLTKEWKQPAVVILQKANFCNMFTLCLWLRIIRRSNQGVQFMNFPSQIFFNKVNHGYKAALLKKNSFCLLSFYTEVTSYCFYEKVHRVMCAAIVLYFYSFSALELNNTESEDEVFAQEFSYEESDF